MSRPYRYASLRSLSANRLLDRTTRHGRGAWQPAYAHWRLGRYRDALPLEQRALQIKEAALGLDHPSTAVRLVHLAITYRELGQANKALPLQERAWQITEAALGSDHPDTAIRLNNLAFTYRALGQADKALPLQERDLQITEAALGPDHPDTATSLGNLAITYHALGQADGQNTRFWMAAAILTVIVPGIPSGYLRAACRSCRSPVDDTGQQATE